jgi:pimeloyl-ACP methyl ester carboxylesterase
MARLALLIHGMWGTPAVWANWRQFLEAHGWRVEVPALRHHDAPPFEPPDGLGTTSLNDYVADLAATIAKLPEPPVIIGHSMGGLIALLLCARGLGRAGVLLTPAPPSSVFAIRPSNLLAFQRIQMNWGWWRKPHRATTREALAYTFNTMDAALATPLCESFVHESGRALFEIAFPWLDGTKAARIAPGKVATPLLLVAAERDKLVPPGIVERTARKVGGDYKLYPNQGHWVLGQPGWQDIATDALGWLDTKI